MPDVNELIGKKVEVGTAETIYIGVLVEINEAESEERSRHVG